MPIGLCGGGIATLSESIPGEETFALNKIVSSRDTDLKKKVILQMCMHIVI